MQHPYNTNVAWLSRQALCDLVREGDPEAIKAAEERIADGPRQQRTTVALRAALKDAGVARVMLHKENRTWRDETPAQRKARLAGV